jgi:Tfp pilus assembly major pilin PilA|tara:strand:- start:261 stop:638 length:378 start_codon:yes stop_codon:yes gene_type:complete
MVSKLRGMTLMSFMIVLVVVGFFALIVMKLFPMYSEYYSLKGVMEEYAAQPNSASLAGGQVWQELERRFDIAYVDSVKREHVKVSRDGGVSRLNIAYEVRVPMFGNLDVVGKFDNTVDLSGRPSQ